MWPTESNRDKHFIYAIPIGFFLTILAVIGVASGMEYKDMLWGGKWDWLDWIATILGGVLGQILNLILIWLFIL